MNKIQSLGAAIIVAVCSCVSFCTIIPADSQYVQSLDGTWRFKLEQAGDWKTRSIQGPPPKIILPKHFLPFQTMDYKEDKTWHDIKVPSNWEMSGYSPATYCKPDNAIGIYRLWFDVPADWKGRIVKLNFDGVQNGAEIYLNGLPVNVSEPAWGRKNYHEGGWDAFQVDLTPAVKFGQKNLLAIRTYKNTKSVDMDTGDYFILGGINRPVTLFSIPKTHIDDLAVRTKLLDGGKAEVRLLMKIKGAAEGDTAVVRLQGEPPLISQVAGQDNIQSVQVVDKPRLWSAEKPNLYDLSVDLKDADGNVIEHLAKQIGIREIEIKNGVFMVNNVPVKLEGICRHDIYPTLGTAIDEKVWRKDIELMKAANINAIRTSHYPYGSGFYDLCDQMGMYVADEMAACWVPTNTDELTPMFKQHARELVRRDKNHPCVIIWAVGNENGKGKNNKIAADVIKQMDPTRPRLISIHNAEEGDVEFDDAHYPTAVAIAEANTEPRREKYPAIYLENPNTWEERNGADYGDLDIWAAVMDRTWDEVWEDRHVPGSFLWEWQDRAVADPGKVHLYDYDPVTGINLVKVKGLVDGFRNPRADYYHVKMVYAPVKVNPKIVIGDSSVTLEITNRYSFTNLSELKATWLLMKGGKKLQAGDAKIALPPLSRKNIKIDLPAAALARADVLRLSFDAADGRNIVTDQFQLKSKPHAALALDATQLDKFRFPKLNLSAVTFPQNQIGWMQVSRRWAHLANIRIERTGDSMNQSPVSENSLYQTPLSQVRAVDADVVLPPVEDHPSNNKAKKPHEPPPAQGKVAHLRVDLVNGQFTYRIDWFGNEADIQELGWSFEVPKEFDHFSWNRKAYWSYYPPTHIGRPVGTATPDSADVHVTKITRPDAFDFNSTKYNCNWAKLTDAAGNGIGVNFRADARENCRGDFTNDGGYRLVVNRYCAPPRDLSSNIVPDFYFTATKNVRVDGAFEVGLVH